MTTNAKYVIDQVGPKIELLRSPSNEIVSLRIAFDQFHYTTIVTEEMMEDPDVFRDKTIETIKAFFKKYLEVEGQRGNLPPDVKQWSPCEWEGAALEGKE